MVLHTRNLEYAYKNYKNLHKQFTSRQDGVYEGYFEACLQAFGVLETEKSDDGTTVLKTEILKEKTWYRKEVRETRMESILRQVEKYLSENNL